MVRLVVRGIWLIALIIVCVPFHLLRRLFGIQSPWPRRFLGWCASAVGVRATIVGRPWPGAALYAANHESWVDILLIGGATGASFVAKEEVRGWPIAGWLATMVGTIYIDRKDRAEALAQAGRIREELVGGKSVAFFPEGRISGAPALKPFRPALFGAVVPPIEGVPVQPVAVDYVEHFGVIAWPPGVDARDHAAALMKRPGRVPVTIHLLDPIFPSAEMDRAALAQACHDAIARALGSAPRIEGA